MKTVSILSATLAAALAAGTATAAPGDTAVTAAASAAAPVVQKDTKRICVVDTLTGSRISRKECRTRAEWANLGIDIDAARR